MREIAYAFTPDQNPAAAALVADPFTSAYEGTGEDEHLIGIYADLCAAGIPLDGFPMTVSLPRPMSQRQANFYAQAERVALLLDAAGRLDSAERLRTEGTWWDFDHFLPLETIDAAGNYLLRVMLRFDEDFEAMVPALTKIFDIENQAQAERFLDIERLSRFQRLMADSVDEDGLMMSTERAWQVSQAWEYEEVRKLLVSDMDVEYGLQLAELGAESFEDAKSLSKTMPKHWIDSLLNDEPEAGEN